MLKKQLLPDLILIERSDIELTESSQLMEHEVSEELEKFKLQKDVQLQKTESKDVKSTKSLTNLQDANGRD